MAAAQNPFDPGIEDEFDRTFRPRSLAEFIGQEKIKRNLQIALDAARGRAEPPEHMLFCGPPGLGKTSLSNIVAYEMGTELHTTSGPALERKRDLVGILTNLQAGDVLFIDEIHRVNPAVAESLYTAMEDFSLAFTLDEGPNARVLSLTIKRFSLLGATTRTGLLQAPFLARFGHTFNLDYYSVAELLQILERTASLLCCQTDPTALALLAERSRGTPRVANRFLRRARDLAQVRSVEVIDVEIVTETLQLLEIDAAGLDAMDRKILALLGDNEGRAIGLKTISAAIGEEAGTIEEVYEPFLLRQGLIERTPRGRRITPRGIAQLGRLPRAGRGLFERELEP